MTASMDESLLLHGHSARYKPLNGPSTTSCHGYAYATDSPVRRDGIEEAVGRRLSMRLGSFGTVISRRARMDELVLPEDVIETLQDMIAMVKSSNPIAGTSWGPSSLRR